MASHSHFLKQGARESHGEAVADRDRPSVSSGTSLPVSHLRKSDKLPSPALPLPPPHPFLARCCWQGQKKTERDRETISPNCFRTFRSERERGGYFGSALSINCTSLFGLRPRAIPKEHGGGGRWLATRTYTERCLLLRA